MELNMVKTILLISVFLNCFVINIGFCQDRSPSPNSVSFNPEIGDKSETYENPEKKTEPSFWRKVWGKKARNAALLGMWSIHVDGTGEYFGNGSNNDQGELVGIQYWGLAAGTFMNSKDDRAWFFGPAREVYSYNFTDFSRFDIGYKFGLLYGYGDDLINVDIAVPELVIGDEVNMPNWEVYFERQQTLYGIFIYRLK